MPPASNVGAEASVAGGHGAGAVASSVGLLLLRVLGCCVSQCAERHNLPEGTGARGGFNR